MTAAYTWESTALERAADYPCDGLLPGKPAALFRAVDVEAPADHLWRWLCQLRAAPYSYDWIDNRGHTSPPRLTPGLENLERGQALMSIFKLVDFEPERHLTMILEKPAAIRWFGAVAGTYRVVHRSGGACRVVVKLLVNFPAGLYGRLTRTLLPWGDLVMMRKQLLTLKALAENQ